MKRILYYVLTIFMFCSCHDNLRERAVREAKEYTKKNCPTPVINYTRTDSVIFDTANNSYVYYCSFVDKLDNENVIKRNWHQIHDGLYKSISNNTGMKVYIDAGFTFKYIVKSNKNPSQVLFVDSIKIQKK